MHKRHSAKVIPNLFSSRDFKSGCKCPSVGWEWRKPARPSAHSKPPRVHSTSKSHVLAKVATLRLNVLSPLLSTKGAAYRSPGHAEPGRGRPGLVPSLRGANPAPPSRVVPSSSVCHAIPSQRLAGVAIDGATSAKIYEYPVQAVLSPPPSKPKTSKQEPAHQTEMRFARRHSEGDETRIVFSWSLSPNGAADYSPGSAEPQRGDPGLGPKLRKANPAPSSHAASTSSVLTVPPPLPACPPHPRLPKLPLPLHHSGFGTHSSFVILNSSLS